MERLNPSSFAAREAADETEQGIRNSYAYFQMPIYLTETSAGLTTETKVAYIHALYAMVLRSRKGWHPYSWRQLVAVVRHDPMGLS